MSPAVGPWASRLYFSDPPRLALRGRALGPSWRFQHSVHGTVTVLSDPAMAAEALAAGLHIAGAERLIPWLGPSSPLTVPLGRRPYLEEAVVTVAGWSARVAAGFPRAFIERALRPARNARADVGAGLRWAVRAWLVEELVGRSSPALAATLPWEAAAATAPLLVPTLRPLYPRFAGLDEARLRMLAALAEGELGPALDGRAGSYIVGCVMALLGPLADALPMLAMNAIALQDPSPARRITRTLALHPPVPIVLLQARRPVELRRARLQLGEGGVVGLDLGGAGLPFGAGWLADAARSIAVRFLQQTLQVVSELDLHAPRSPVRGRVRLCWGPVSLQVAKWAATP